MNLHIRTVLPEHLPIENTKYGCRGCLSPKFRHVDPLDRSDLRLKDYFVHIIQLNLS